MKRLKFTLIHSCLVEKYHTVVSQPIIKPIETIHHNSYQDHNLWLRVKGHLLQTRPNHKDIS